VLTLHVIGTGFLVALLTGLCTVSFAVASFRKTIP
jgi:hypothetical protein